MLLKNCFIFLLVILFSVAINIPCSQKFVKPKTQKNFNFLCVETLYPLKRKRLQYGLKTSRFFLFFQQLFQMFHVFFVTAFFALRSG